MDSDLYDLLVDQLHTAYSAERKSLRCLELMLRHASDTKLRDCLQTHINETDLQIERLTLAMEEMEIEVNRQASEAIRGLIDEAQFAMADWDESPVKDAVIIKNLLLVEHYEIAAYVSLVAFVQLFNKEKAAEWLQANLQEEQAMAQRLVAIMLADVLPTAMDDEA